MDRSNPKRKKLTSIVLVGSGLLLILAALLLLVSNLNDDDRAKRRADDILRRFPAVETKTSGEEEPAFVRDPAMEMPVAEIDGYSYIGRLTLPALELELPVMDSWDYAKMKIAPCRYTGSLYSGDLVVCAHNYVSHFGRLKNTQVGDPILFTDVDGNVFHFTAVEIEELPGTAIEDMQLGDWDLSLFTCTLSGSARVTVRCVFDDYELVEPDTTAADPN